MSAAGALVASLVLTALVAIRVAVGRWRALRVSRRLPLDRTVAREVPHGWLTRHSSDALRAAGVEQRPDAVVTGAAAVTVALAAIGALSGGLALAVLLPLLGVAGGAGALVVMRGRGDRRYEAALPLALDLVARSLRTGASLHQAIDEAAGATRGPVADDLRAVVIATRLGRSLVAAIDAWATARPLAGVRLAAAALCLGAETGGAQARAIDGVAATLREHLALAGEVRALTSQARTSALVIALAPVGFCALTVATDAESAAFLLRTPLGLTLLAAGLLLDGVAALWMHRLTSRVAAR